MMDLFRMALGIGMEEIADGVVRDEIEHVYYVQLADFEQLGKADSVDKQEQWEIKIPEVPSNIKSGKLRVRAVDDGKGEGVKYILTAKVQFKGDDHPKEANTETSEGMFELFKLLCKKGMRKERYCFPVEDLMYEVDVFRKPDGSFFEWVKVDLEVPNTRTTIPPFPLEFVRMISEPYGKRTPEDEKLISGFYENEYVLKNAQA